MSGVGTVAVVFNPTKFDDPARSHDDICAELHRRGLDDIVWLETTEDDPGQVMCAEALDAHDLVMVFAAGGDGTVQACVTAVAGRGVPLAVLASGTGNLVASNFGIPSTLADAVDVAVDGEPRVLDVGVVGDQRFVVMSGIGFDAHMLRDAHPATKRRFGSIAYVVSAVRHLRDPLAAFRITIDRGEPFVRRGRAVLVGNLGSLQGDLVLLPDADPTDGILDVGVLRATSLRDWLGLAGSVLARRTPARDRFETFRGAHVVVQSRPELPYEVDGEDKPATKTLEVSIEPGALRLMVPVTRTPT